MKVVSNSSPLIHLTSVGDLDILRRLFERIILPPAVYTEVVTHGGVRPGALEVEHAIVQRWMVMAKAPPESQIQDIMSEQALGRGEAEVIALACEIGADFVLLDEEAAVSYARWMRLRVIRSAGVYIAARQAGLILSVRERLDRLREAGFWLRARDYIAILTDCDEIAGNE